MQFFQRVPFQSGSGGLLWRIRSKTSVLWVSCIFLRYFVVRVKGTQSNLKMKRNNPDPFSRSERFYSFLAVWIYGGVGRLGIISIDILFEHD